MWLLILALVMLYISAVLSSYYALSLMKPKWEGPPLLMGKGEKVFMYTHIVVSLIGVAMLFIAVGWKWWLIGLGAYWGFVVFVLMPIMHIILNPPRPKLFIVICWPLAIFSILRSRR